MRQAPFWADLEAVAPTLAYDHTAIMGATLAVPTDRLAAVVAPMLALCGGSSPPFMCASARTVSQAVPNGKFRKLDGQTHDVQPAVLAPVLIEFLSA